MGVLALTTQTHAHICTHTNTHTHHMDHTGARSLDQLRKSTYKYIAYVVGSESQEEGNAARNMHRTWRVIDTYTQKGGV